MKPALVYLHLLLVASFAASSAASSAPAATYDAACDAIVEAAQQAARAQRAGNQQGADRYVALTLSRFEAAKNLAPNEPQARWGGTGGCRGAGPEMGHVPYIIIS